MTPIARLLLCSGALVMAIGVILGAMSSHWIRTATHPEAPADYPQYGAGYYAVFFADPDGLKFEYVHVPGQTHERRGSSMARPQVLHHAAVDSLAREARCRQPRLEQRQRAAVVGRDGPAGDELLREVKRGLVERRHQARRSSLMDVLARVASSTRFTITAQLSAYLPSADGRLPGTTTEPDGTRP